VWATSCDIFEKNMFVSWAQWYMPVIPALRKIRQEDEFSGQPRLRSENLPQTNKS
jgi:hypothetical protein